MHSSSSFQTSVPVQCVLWKGEPVRYSSWQSAFLLLVCYSHVWESVVVNNSFFWTRMNISAEAYKDKTRLGNWELGCSERCCQCQPRLLRRCGGPAQYRRKVTSRVEWFISSMPGSDDMTPRLVRQATAWVHIQLGLENRLELPFYFPIHGMGEGGMLHGTGFNTHPTSWWWPLAWLTGALRPRFLLIAFVYDTYQPTSPSSANRGIPLMSIPPTNTFLFSLDLFVIYRTLTD